MAINVPAFPWILFFFGHCKIYILIIERRQNGSSKIQQNIKLEKYIPKWKKRQFFDQKNDFFDISNALILYMYK